MKIGKKDATMKSGNAHQGKFKPYVKDLSKQPQAKIANQTDLVKQDFSKAKKEHRLNQLPSIQNETVLSVLREPIAASESVPAKEQGWLVRGEFLQPIEGLILSHDFKEKEAGCFASGFPFFFAYTREQSNDFIISDAHESLYRILDTKPDRFASKQQVDEWKKLASKTGFAMTEKEKTTTTSLGTINDLNRCGIDPSAMTILLNLTHLTGDLPHGREDIYLIESALLHTVLSKAGIKIAAQEKTTKILQEKPKKHIDAVKAELLTSAAAWENPNILHEMLLQGYDPSAVSPLSLRNPMSIAVLHGNTVSRKLLLQYGAIDETIRPEEPLDENLDLDVI